LVSVTVYASGVGESSPLSNTLWGFANLPVRFVFLSGSSGRKIRRRRLDGFWCPWAVLLTDVIQQAECGYNMVENFIHDSGLDFIRSIQGEWVLD
jgi:hypothetical protein